MDHTEAAEVIVSLAHMIAHMKFAGSDDARIKRTDHTRIENYIGTPGTDLQN